MIKRISMYAAVIALLLSAVPTFAQTAPTNTTTIPATLTISESISASASPSVVFNPTTGIAPPVTLTVSYNLGSTRTVVGYVSYFTSGTALTGSMGSTIPASNVYFMNGTSQTTAVPCTMSQSSFMGNAVGLTNVCGSAQVWNLSGVFSATKTDSLTYSVHSLTGLASDTFSGQITVMVGAS